MILSVRYLVLLCIMAVAFPAQGLDELSVSRLSKSQRKELHNYLENNYCTCGCGYTIGGCIRDDPTCPVSPRLAKTAIETLISNNYTAPPAPKTKRTYKRSGKLDKSLIRSWIRRTNAANGIYVENTIKMIFSADGRVEYGSGAIVAGGVGGISIRGGGNNPTSFGAWSIKSGRLHVVWESEPAGTYDYEVFVDYKGTPALMINWGGGKVYFRAY